MRLFAFTTDAIGPKWGPQQEKDFILLLIITFVILPTEHSNENL